MTFIPLLLRHMPRIRRALRIAAWRFRSRFGPSDSLSLGVSPEKDLKNEAATRWPTAAELHYPKIWVVEYYTSSGDYSRLRRLTRSKSGKRHYVGMDIDEVVRRSRTISLDSSSVYLLASFRQYGHAFLDGEEAVLPPWVERLNVSYRAMSESVTACVFSFWIEPEMSLRIYQHCSPVLQTHRRRNDGRVMDISAQRSAAFDETAGELLRGASSLVARRWPGALSRAGGRPAAALALEGSAAIAPVGYQLTDWRSVLGMEPFGTLRHDGFAINESDFGLFIFNADAGDGLFRNVRVEHLLTSLCLLSLVRAGRDLEQRVRDSRLRHFDFRSLRRCRDIASGLLAIREPLVLEPGPLNPDRSPFNDVLGKNWKWIRREALLLDRHARSLTDEASGQAVLLLSIVSIAIAFLALVASTVR